MLIRITLASGRTDAAKQAFYARLATLLAERLVYERRTWRWS